MQKLGLNDAGPQFSTAEYAAGARDQCSFCKQPVAQSYYRINGALACPSCADRARRDLPGGEHAAYVRGVMFGAGGALLGLVLYAAVGIITGWIIGYVSLAVGYIVGKSMMKGSGGRGGRRYQIAALLLTYAAVSLAAVPMGVAQFAKHSKAKAQARAQAQAAVMQPGDEKLTRPVPGTKPPVAPKPRMGLGAALASLALLGLASPFLALWMDAFHGLIGIVILLVGSRIAWRITAGHPALEVAGPFDTTSPSAA